MYVLMWHFAPFAGSAIDLNTYRLFLFMAAVAIVEVDFISTSAFNVYLLIL